MALAGGLLAATATGPPPARAATRPPVVLIVLDEFPVDSLLLPDGRIDARRFPGFASLARHSTWFPNAGAVYLVSVRARTRRPQPQPQVEGPQNG